MALMLRADLEAQEAAVLAPYASRSAGTRGRAVTESVGDLRTEYQRDRDRIVHCEAFRKLEYKTQVYVTHEGDFFRTRLTHTIEVAQIARTMARALGANPDLTEAIALAHDLGHTPFGHMGERVLQELLKDDGGFEHNEQSLRVVEELEDRFHDRPGLNLTWEVREGIAHHATAYDQPRKGAFHEGRRQPSLEAQLVDMADTIAYNHHDLDDALSMGLIEVEELRELDWVWEIWRETEGRLPDGSRHVHYRALGALIEQMVHDVVHYTHAELERHAIRSPEHVRAHGRRLAAYSPAMREQMDRMCTFMMSHAYRHPTTLRQQTKAGAFFRRLFELYRDNPEMLPRRHHARIAERGLLRVVTDYMSGLTDRACLEEYMNHFEPTLRWSK